MVLATQSAPRAFDVPGTKPAGDEKGLDQTKSKGCYHDRTLVRRP